MAKGQCIWLRMDSEARWSIGQRKSSKGEEYGKNGVRKQIKVQLSSILDGASDRKKEYRTGGWEQDASLS